MLIKCLFVTGSEPIKYFPFFILMSNVILQNYIILFSHMIMLIDDVKTKHSNILKTCNIFGV